MECGSYRAKLLEHAMKVIERTFERRIREKVKKRPNKPCKDTSQLIT